MLMHGGGSGCGPSERERERVSRRRRKRNQFMVDTHNMFDTLEDEEEDEGPPGLMDSDEEEEANARQTVRKSRWSRRRSVNWKNRTGTHSCDSDSGCGSVVAGVRSLVEETTDTANGYR